MKRKILVVDDEKGVVDSFRFALEEEGMEVYTASNGTEAFTVIQKHAPQGVISDIRMRGGSGIELLDRIGTMPSAKKPFVILISGFSDVSEEEIVKKGGRKLLSKPVSFKRFLEEVNEAFEDFERGGVQKTKFYVA